MDFLSLPRANIAIDAGAPLGPLETWRHSLGHGGINPLPLPERVVQGVSKLKPRLVRIFLQEFFAVYPDHGRFDWSRLDPYMDALARTGARVVAAITIKPPVLFPQVDHSVWEPNNVEEWQGVLFEMVRRYSVEKEIVTHWEIGNETDIGEQGGTPHLIPQPEAYARFYEMALDPVLKAFPEAKVGGPAACWVDNEPLPGLIQHCARTGTRLDFISWHLYSDDPARHALGVEKAKRLLEGFPGKRPEMFVTEWSKGFDRVSVEEMAFAPRRAAVVAASILEMLEAGLDASFYYHIWDQTCYARDFAPFFSERGIAGMLRHWNEVPHRFGLFGVGEEVRPQYFVYQMLGRLGDERISARSEDAAIRVLAGRDGEALSVMLINFRPEASEDRVAQLQFQALQPGTKELTVYRIDADCRWSAERLELLPIERRVVDTGAEFAFQVYCPADSVTLMRLVRSAGC